MFWVESNRNVLGGDKNETFTIGTHTAAEVAASRGAVAVAVGQRTGVAAVAASEAAAAEYIYKLFPMISLPSFRRGALTWLRNYWDRGV